MADPANTVRTAITTMMNRTEALRMRGFILKERLRVMGDLLSCGQSRTDQFVRRCASGHGLQAGEACGMFRRGRR